MNETLQRLLDKLRDAAMKLTPRQKAWLGGIAVVAAVATLIGSVIARRDPYQVLYTDLQGEDQRAVAKKLGEHSIPHQFDDNGATVSVPGSMVAQARMQLAKDGVPGQDVVGFEKFDGSTLGMSTYVQRIQYVRAVQGELTRSIQRLASVKNARVHISMPPKKTFLEDEDPPKASVVLELRPGQIPSKTETNGIAHLVASAVEGLKVSQVTIVDTRGTFLHRPEDAGAPGLSSAMLEMQRSIESEYEKRIEEILVPVVGLGKVRAKVTAEIDPSRTNTTEESFDPDRATPRTTVRNEETTNGSRPNPIGIPGSRSNLPGAEANNPAVPMANTNSEKNVQNTTYAIPRKISIVDKPGGNIKRLTIAVVVDGVYEKAPGATAETFSPRPDEEIQRLQQLVGNAVGYDLQRRDSISVTSLPFRPTELMPDVPEVAPAPWWKALDPRSLGPVGIIAILALIVGAFTMMRSSSRRRASDQAIANGINAMPRTIAELEAERAAEEGKLGVGPNGARLGPGGVAGGPGGVSILGEESEPLEKQEELELIRRILERLGSSPKKGFRVVQDWLDEEKIPQPVEAA